MKKKLMILLATTCLSMQEVSAMSLEEALVATYTNNDAMKGARQVFLKDIEAFPQALANFLPDVGAKVSTTNSKQKSDSQFSPGATSQEAGPDVSRALVVTQNLFSGGQHVAGLKIAQAQFWISRSALYNAEQKILNDALQRYLNVCAQRETYAIAEDALVFYKQNLEMVEERLKVGEATVTDVAVARANFAKSEAAKSQQYALLISSYADFKSITGLEPDDEMSFPDIPKDIPETKEQLESMTLKSNFDIISIKHSLLQAKHGVKSEAGALLPSADLKIQAAKNFFSPEQAANQRQNNMSYSTSVTVNIPIFSNGGLQYSKIRQHKKAARQVVHSLDSLEKQLKSQVVSTWESFSAGKDTINYSDKYVEAQTMALDGVKQQYSVGAATMLDVLKVQEDLNNARSQAVQSKQTYLVNAYKIKILLGQLTAQKLKLNTKYFSPEQEFKRIKHKIIGF